MEGQQISVVFSAAGAGLLHALWLSKGSRENRGKGTAVYLFWTGGNETSVPFDCCQGYILVEPDFGSILVGDPNVPVAVQT